MVSPDEAGLAVQALQRRDGLEPRARVELFRRLAQHFRSLAEFPAEATADLADEQYVRNVVDSVYHTVPVANPARSTPPAQ
jgi:hypothetical protein